MRPSAKIVHPNSHQATNTSILKSARLILTKPPNHDESNEEEIERENMLALSEEARRVEVFQDRESMSVHAVNYQNIVLSIQSLCPQK
jgi:hypothetical protein